MPITRTRKFAVNRSNCNRENFFFITVSPDALELQDGIPTCLDEYRRYQFPWTASSFTFIPRGVKATDHTIN